jgi:hypothetical protein
LVPVASYQTLEEAESAGSFLLDHDISTDLRGSLGRGGPVTLFVDKESLDRARALLGLADAPRPESRPFRPCPECGSGDPLWYGKRKALLLLGLSIIVGGLAVARSPAFSAVAIVSVIVFVIYAWRIPEFECRNCHRRWSKNTR